MDLGKDETIITIYRMLCLFSYVHFSCAFSHAVASMVSEHAQKDDLLSRSPQAEGNVGYFLLWI